MALGPTDFLPTTQQLSICNR
jgi:hypothetical protein